MPDVELRYWPLNKPIPEGWVRHDGLDDTHHGAYSTFIVKRNGGREGNATDDPGGPLRTLTASAGDSRPDRLSTPLCSCGQPLKTVDEGHAVVTVCCRRVLEGCCGDV